MPDGGECVAGKRKGRKHVLLPYLLLLPSIIVLCMFVFYPFVRNIVLSLTMTDVAGNVVKFVGFRNYQRLFSNKTFLNSMQVSFRFAAMVGIPSFVIGFVLALTATEQRRGSRIYETMYTMPLVIAAAPASAIWYMVFSSTGGMLNFLTGMNRQWLSDPQTAIWCVAAVTVWANLGLNVIFLLTGFRNVPQDLIESAKIDGAGYFTRVVRIVIPLASPQIFFVIFYNIVTSFQTFAQVRLLTDGGPYYSTNVLIFQIYKEAFYNSRFYNACAMSVILFLVVFIITRVQFFFEKRGVYY